MKRQSTNTQKTLGKCPNPDCPNPTLGWEGYIREEFTGEWGDTGETTGLVIAPANLSCVSCGKKVDSYKARGVEKEI